MSGISDYIVFNSGAFIPTKKWATAGAGKGNPKPHWWSKKSTNSSQDGEGGAKTVGDDKSGDAASIFSERTLVEPRNRQLEQWNARKAEREARLARQKIAKKDGKS